MNTFARGAYTLLLGLVLPVLVLKLAFRNRLQGRSKNTNRFLERFALRLPEVGTGSVIFHCASVGETLAAAKLIDLFIANNPQQTVTITSTSPNAATIISQRFGNRVNHVYLPFDLPVCVSRFLNHIQPKLLVILETEIWPNLCFHAHKRGIPLILLNARLSDKSYASYKKFSALTKSMINQFDFICCQTQADANNFAKLELASTKLRVFGNLKFAVDPGADTESQAQTIRQQRFHNRPAWLAASTHPGEDEILIAAHKHLLEKHKDLILIIAPRHPHRTAAIESLVEKADLFSVRHTAERALAHDEAVYIVDTLGELMRFIAATESCFVGGSLIEHGGHNPLEPAALKKPIISGQYVHNFQKIYQDLAADKAVIFANNAVQIYEAIDELICNKEIAEQFGQRAFAYQQKHQGAIESSLDLLNQSLCGRLRY